MLPKIIKQGFEPEPQIQSNGDSRYDTDTVNSFCIHHTHYHVAFQVSSGILNIK